MSRRESKEARRRLQAAQAQEVSRLFTTHAVVDSNLIVQTARSPDSTLHQRFPWDDRVAAHERRLEIAKEILREYHIWFREHDRVRVVPEYVHDPADSVGYRQTALVSVGDDAGRGPRVLLPRVRQALTMVNNCDSLATMWNLDIPELTGAAALLDLAINRLEGEAKGIKSEPPPLSPMSSDGLLPAA
jgi:hypothetical protein